LACPVRFRDRHSWLALFGLILGDGTPRLAYDHPRTHVYPVDVR